MYASGRAATLGQRFREQAFISGFQFGLDNSTINQQLGGERLIHPLPCGPEVTASAPFPSRAGTSFVDGAALSVRNSKLNLTLHHHVMSSSIGASSTSTSIKPKFFADGSPAKFDWSSPDLATIVKEAAEDCVFPDDPGEIAVE
eukprot:2563404-Rhodomonas_salina.1